MHFVFYCIVDSLKDKCSYLKKPLPSIRFTMYITLSFNWSVRSRNSRSSAPCHPISSILFFHTNPLQVLLHNIHEYSLRSSSFPFLAAPSPKFFDISTTSPLNMFSLASFTFISKPLNLNCCFDTLIFNPVHPVKNLNISTANSILASCHFVGATISINNRINIKSRKVSVVFVT